MKKFSLKFILFVIISVFSSLAYADGVFSRYYNTSYDFSVAVPLKKYEQDTNEGSKINELEFIKKSNIIPSKDYFKGHGALAGDGIAIKNKNGDTSILVYGTYILHDFNAENLAEDKIKESFDAANLDYNKFIKKYYNGKLPKEIDELKFDYNKTLFRLGNSVAYSTFGKDFYVISYIKDNKVEYIKVINNNDTNYIIFEASYLPKDKKFMDPIVTEISKSINLIK